MKNLTVVVDGKVYDSDVIPIIIIFPTDDVRKLVAEQLTNMPEKEAIRMYAVFPEGQDGKKIIAEAKSLVS